MRHYPRIRMRPGMIPQPMHMPSTLPMGPTAAKLHTNPPAHAERPISSIASIVSAPPPSSPARHLPVDTSHAAAEAMRPTGGRCLQCGVHFKHPGALAAHMTECGVAAKCPFCPMVLRHRQMLVEHVETHRPGYVA